ncbi:MAG: WhiB family transcriptional regulator [Dermatophilaceae bacterium]
MNRHRRDNTAALCGDDNLQGQVPTDTAAAEGGDWQVAALCAQVDPELFFPEDGGSAREALAVCLRCPVRAQCLEAALARGERFGVWGGMTPGRLARLRRERRIAARSVPDFVA